MVKQRTVLMVGGLCATIWGCQSHLAASGGAYEYVFPALQGGDIRLVDYAGKVVLVVNTASRCGFTPQYEALESLWEAYKGQGLIVLAVPSNDFGGQEPGTSQEIADFCQTTFHLSFPMTEKVHVTGDQAHPFYRWAKKTLGWWAAPKWNFHKYLLGRDGQLVDWFSTVTDPQSKKVRTAIERALQQNP